jgi:hypothetical protein
MRPWTAITRTAEANHARLVSLLLLSRGVHLRKRFAITMHLPCPRKPRLRVSSVCRTRQSTYRSACPQ